MTLFQLFNTLFQNEIIKKDIYLDRLKELKASKEKELEEIIKAISTAQKRGYNCIRSFTWGINVY